MALLGVLAMEKSEGEPVACATAAIWLLDCSVEEKSEREREAAAAYYVCVSMQCKDRDRERREQGASEDAAADRERKG